MTGASGFIGKTLCRELTEKNYRVCCVYRVSPLINQSSISIGNIDTKTKWQNALTGVEVVVHLAARVHVMNKTASDSLAAFREVNVGGTLNLARQAAKAGVLRFIYLSSIKVNGEKTTFRPFTEENEVEPRDPYGQSKLEAEKGLWEIARQTGLEVVIVRPPLVYGPGVKANFFRLLDFVKKEIPLPFGSVKNLRSLVFLDNLVDFLILCIEHPNAADETFLISDCDDLSTPAIIQCIAKHMNTHIRLVPIPVGALRLAGKIVGKSAQINRICDSLQVDMSKAKMILGWNPPFSVDEGFKKTVEWFTHCHFCGD